MVAPAAASATSVSGSNPKSAFCKLEKAALATNSPTSAKEAAATKAMLAGNWKTAQKIFLSLYGQTGKLEQEMTSALSSAPANVRAAAQQTLKIVPAELNAIEHSTSVAQFETAMQKVASGAKFTKAATTLEGYESAQCGTI